MRVDIGRLTPKQIPFYVKNPQAVKCIDMLLADVYLQIWEIYGRIRTYPPKFESAESELDKMQRWIKGIVDERCIDEKTAKSIIRSVKFAIDYAKDAYHDIKDGDEWGIECSEGTVGRLFDDAMEEVRDIVLRITTKNFCNI